MASGGEELCIAWWTGAAGLAVDAQPDDAAAQQRGQPLADVVFWEKAAAAAIDGREDGDGSSVEVQAAEQRRKTQRRRR